MTIRCHTCSRILVPRADWMALTTSHRKALCKTHAVAASDGQCYTHARRLRAVKPKPAIVYHGRFTRRPGDLIWRGSQRDQEAS